MFLKKGLPAKDELVLCTVKRINPHSAFVTLDEFEDAKGMIHISEVALRGVKNIKNHLSINKKVVCKVLYIKDDLVDVSLKRVKSGERKHKLNESRIEKRFYHLVEYACKEAKKKGDTAKVVQGFIDKFGSIVNAYEALKDRGLKFLDGVNLPDKVGPLLCDSFQSLLKSLSVKINRVVSVSSIKGDGVERIKSLLTGIKPPKGVIVDLIYKGSGDFTLTIEAMNYKIAEEYFDDLSESLVADGQKNGVLVSFSD